MYVRVCAHVVGVCLMGRGLRRDGLGGGFISLGIWKAQAEEMRDRQR